jgi:hypothetical protein
MLLLPCIPFADPLCYVNIRLATGANNVILNVGEVELYHLVGARIPISELQVMMSSTYNDGGGTVPWQASNAIDDNADTPTATMLGDPNPYLAVFYRCPSGITSVSRVVVVNRRDPVKESVDRINSFELEHVTAFGIKDRPTFRFSGGQPVYNISQPAGGCCCSFWV